MACSRIVPKDQRRPLLAAAGWPSWIIPLMDAIFSAESNWCVDAYNPGVGPGGRATAEKSIGIAQINMLPSLGRTYDRQRLATDPLYNLKVAYEIYKQQGLTAWGAYTDRRYLKYYSGAAVAPDQQPGAGSVGSGFLGSIPFFGSLFSPVPAASDRFAPYLDQRPAFTGKQRLTAVYLIALLLLIFYID